MMFEAKLVCDCLGCHEELELDIEHPDDAMWRVEQAESIKGWKFDVENGFSYCPACKVKVEAEANE